MILLQKITLKDFLSHQMTEISFKDNEKILLDGKSGGGKTAVVEAILFALYGRGRSDNRNLVRKGQKNASVSLRLIDKNQEYIITRTISSIGKNSLMVTTSLDGGKFLPVETTGLKDTQLFIEEKLLHSSYELFTNSVAYPQDNENSFVKANASRRKDLLLEIVRAGDFTELYEKARKAISLNDLDSAVVVSKVESLEISIKNAEEVANKYDSYKLEVDATSIQIETELLIEKDLETQLNNISNISNQITAKREMGKILTDSIRTIDVRLEADKKKVEEHKSLDITSAREDILVIEGLEKEVEGLGMELGDSYLAQQKINAHLSNKPQCFDYSKDIELINKRLIPLIKDTSKCPAGDLCPFVAPIKGQIDFLTEQITEKTEKIVSEKKTLEEWERQYVNLVPAKDSDELYKSQKELMDKIKILSQSKDIVVQYELFEKTYTEIKDREIKLNEEFLQKNKDLTSIEIQIRELEKTLVNINSNEINSNLSRIRIALKELNEMKSNASIGMAMAIRAQSTVKDATLEFLELRKAISRAWEEKEALELLKEAFSPRGIKAVIIDYLVPTLEQRINDVLGQLSDFRIRLDTQQPLVGEDGLKEGLFITVLNAQREELPLANLSGGEGVKISMAISEALAGLSNTVGFRILDEAINSLDSESTQSFVEVLLKLQEKFPQVLCVSHLDEVKDIFEKKVMISKINGVSKII